MERMRKRAERFGSSVSPAIAKVKLTMLHECSLIGSIYSPQVEDEERKKKRIEKFGLTTVDLNEEV